MRSILRKIAFIGIFCSVFFCFMVLAFYVGRWNIKHVLVKILPDCNEGTSVFFSPDDDLRTHLISLIDGEQKKICFALYTLTDKEIAQALVRAAKRGVSVSGVVDKSYGYSRYSKVGYLANAQVPIWVYQTSDNARYPGLMHNKFCIFYDTLDHQAIVWTGSYNFTNQANEYNQENVVLLKTPSIIATYQNYFVKLTERSLQISGLNHD